MTPTKLTDGDELRAESLAQDLLDRRRYDGDDVIALAGQVLNDVRARHGSKYAAEWTLALIAKLRLRLGV